MALVGGVSFAGGMFFFMLGAWPVVGFLGLDVLLVYWAFRANYRAAAAFEEVTVTPSELRAAQGQPPRRGRANGRSIRCGRKLDRETHEDFGLLRLFLVSRGRQARGRGLPVARRRGKASPTALSAALGEARRGPTRTRDCRRSEIGWDGGLAWRPRWRAQ